MNKHDELYKFNEQELQLLQDNLALIAEYFNYSKYVFEEQIASLDLDVDTKKQLLDLYDYSLSYVAEKLM